MNKVGQVSIFLYFDVSVCLLQDDTYTESYISTIGVDFVSSLVVSFDTLRLRTKFFMSYLLSECGH